MVDQKKYLKNGQVSSLQSFKDFYVTGDRLIECWSVGNKKNSLFKSQIYPGSYLGLCLDRTTDTASQISSNEYQVPVECAYRNNGSIIVLNGSVVSLAWFPHYFSHANYIFLEKELSVFSTLLVKVGITRGVLLGKWKHVGEVSIRNDDCDVAYIVLATTTTSKHSTRKYVHPRHKGSDFFEYLNTAKYKYVLLRWFSKDDVSSRDLHEDFDVLIADDDYERLEKKVAEEPGIVPYDFYTTTGARDAQYLKLPYYPPECAKQLLENSCLVNNIKVPSGRMYYLSLLFHIVFHKGYNSGLQSLYREVTFENPEHDYHQIITELAIETKQPLIDSLEDGARVLQEAGWHPSIDMLRKLALSNKWVRDCYDEQLKGGLNLDKEPGLMVCLVREAGVPHIDTIVRLLRKEGFYILKSERIKDKNKAVASSKIRGGNWGSGPWPVSAGLPAHFIVCYDVLPVSLKKTEKIKYPFVDNKRILVKERIRKYLNDRLPEAVRNNPLHTSDNTAESFEYLTFLDSEYVVRVEEEIHKLKKSFAAPYTPLKTLSGGGRRAKIESIVFNGLPAVCKTFKPGAEKYLEREAKAYDELSRECTAIPRAHVITDRYIILPNFLPVRRRYFGLLPLEAVRTAYNVMKYLYEKNMYWGDATPQNIMRDMEGNYVCIDFEFLQPYTTPPKTFAAGYDAGQSPIEIKVDLPGLRLRRDSDDFDSIWKPAAGISLADLENGLPDYILHLKRLLYIVQTFPVKLGLSVLQMVKKYTHEYGVQLLRKFMTHIDALVLRLLTR